MASIWQVFGTDAHEMTYALLEAADARLLVSSSSVVALKPNLVLAATAEGGAVTHPGVLSGCIAYFQDHGVRDLSVIESSWVGDQTMRAMRRAGYEEVLRRYDVPFFDLKRDRVVHVASPIGELGVCERALTADLLVDLPVLKGHCQTRMTCALKNLKGCIPDREKRRYHTLGLTRPIAALASVLRPRLTVVDSICGDLCFEEGGTPVQTNRMYVCLDPVCADAYGRTLMGLRPEEVPYIELAERYGAGSATFTEDDLVTLNEARDAASYPRPSASVARITKGVHANDACSACFASLVRALYTSGSTPDVPVHIGQGFAGQDLPGLGIGRCCAGAEVTVPGCPPSADAIVRCLERL